MTKCYNCNKNLSIWKTHFKDKRSYCPDCWDKSKRQPKETIELKNEKKSIKYSDEIKKLEEEHYLWEFMDEYYLCAKNPGEVYGGFTLQKEEIIEIFTKNNGNIEKVKKELFGRYNEAMINKKVEEMRLKKWDMNIREEAEKRLYGQVKTKREPLKEEDKEIIFSKFNNECSVCGAKEGLHIHHKDKNPKNNQINNLIVLCGVCHKKIHMNVR